MNSTNTYRNSSSKKDKNFTLWIMLWIGASILLYVMNVFTTPGFWWSAPFILLWSVLMGARALKIDQERNRAAQDFLLNPEEEKLSDDPLELEKRKVFRNWEESDFV